MVSQPLEAACCLTNVNGVKERVGDLERGCGVDRRSADRARDLFVDRAGQSGAHHGQQRTVSMLVRCAEARSSHGGWLERNDRCMTLRHRVWMLLVFQIWEQEFAGARSALREQSAAVEAL